MTNPTPAQIIKARKDNGHTQAEAMAVLGITGKAAYRTWQNWELGLRKMPQANYELYLIKTKKD